MAKKTKEKPAGKTEKRKAQTGLQAPRRMMKRNVNLGLLFIILFLLTGLIGATLFFQDRYTRLQTEYHEEKASLEKTIDELNRHKKQLNRTATELQIKEESSEQLEEIYTGVKSEKEKIEYELKTSEEELKSTMSKYQKAKLDIKIKRQELAKAESELKETKEDLEDEREKRREYGEEIDRLKGRITSAVSRLDSAGGACDAQCIAAVKGDLGG